MKRFATVEETKEIIELIIKGVLTKNNYPEYFSMVEVEADANGFGIAFDEKFRNEHDTLIKEIFNEMQSLPNDFGSVKTSYH